MTTTPSRRGSAAKDSGNYHNQDRKADIVTMKKGKHIIKSVRSFERHIMSLVNPNDFLENTKLNEDILQTSVNKQTIAVWLATAMEILEKAVVHIEGAFTLHSIIADVKEKNRVLLKEKVDDQKTVIKLQNELMNKKDSELQSVQETVQTEMRACASVLNDTCSSALAPRNIQSALKQLSVEPDVRNVNIPDLQVNKGSETKGVDWSLNGAQYNNRGCTAVTTAGPSAPTFSGDGQPTKGVDWALNRPPQSTSQVHPAPHHHGNQPPPNPAILRHGDQQSMAMSEKPSTNHDFPSSASSMGEPVTAASYASRSFAVPPSSAPPEYSERLPGSETKGVDWSLNGAQYNNRGCTAATTAGPSAPTFSGDGQPTKGVDWALNRPPQSTSQVHPAPHHHGNQPPPNPAILRHGAQQSMAMADPFTRWKEEFSRHYPDSKLSRDNPSLMRVEIPINRAFPVLGHATCPDCFDGGPHERSIIKKKDGIISVKKIPCQKCRRCFKLLYFIHSAVVTVVEAPRVNKPPPYVNRPLPQGSGNLNQPQGHGWSNESEGHGWGPADGGGHGWGD